uniref:Uncharacterized protein n=1 Tax=Meleagris gallopavo TaxID=9103 RepID=A0A803Y512_MELGA
MHPPASITGRVKVWNHCPFLMRMRMEEQLVHTTCPGEYCRCISYSLLLLCPSAEREGGSTFICNTHIIPVKNQEGVAMMFIINFEYVTDEENIASPEKCNPILPSKLVNHGNNLSSGSSSGKLFGFRLPGLRLLTYRKQSLPQEDPDAVIIDSSKHSDDSVALKHFKSPTKESCSPSEVDDTKALIQPSKCSPMVNISGPLDHSSPKQQWDRLYPDMIQTSNPLTHSRSKESICSIRRASSVHDIEGFNVHAKNIFRDRHASEGPFNHIKSSLLGSTSDSNLNKYSTINKIPQLTLNFSDIKNEKKSSSPPSSEKAIIAPKVKDRTHNVTEKVTQVRYYLLFELIFNFTKLITDTLGLYIFFTNSLDFLGRFDLLHLQFSFSR